MPARTTVTLLISFMLITTAFASGRGPTIEDADVRKLLIMLESMKDDRETLATLFKIGDEQISELIKALDDPDPKVRLHAQIVIRYLGNEMGMKALENWFSKQAEVVASGPIPLPLKERDYAFIRDQYLSRPVAAWRTGDQYIYALALDGSPRAKAVLRELKKSAGATDDSTVAGRAIRLATARDGERVLVGQRDLAKSVIENAFFIATSDRRFTSAKLLGLNRAKQKALIEIYINRGRLAEEWYHVVLSKHRQGWKFFSITQVAVS